MKRVEIEQKLNEIHQAIGSLDALKQNVFQTQKVVENAQGQVTDLTTKAQQASDLLNQALANKPVVDGYTVSLEKAAKVAEEYGKLVKVQKTEFTDLKSKTENLQNSQKELEDLARGQLGLISMETLANAFATEADKLEKSTHVWLKKLLWTTVLLMIAVIAITIWQVVEEKTLVRFSFAIRLPIISPLVYYLYFVAHQYSREKKLLEEYSFKASIARSFEAYRKVLKEESANEQDLARKNELILGTIKDVYSSPMANIANNKLDINEIKKDDADLLGKILDFGEKFKSLLTK